MRALLSLLVFVLPAGASAQVPASAGYGYVPPETAIACGETGVCAAGSSCVDGACVSYDGSVSAPEVADREYERRSRAHTKLMIAGGVIFGGAWLIDGIVSLFAGYRWGIFTSDSTWEPGWDGFRGVAWIPLVGPWIQLGLRNDSTPFNVFLSIDGAVQAIGLTLLVLGAVLEGENRPDHPAFALGPMLGEDRVGLEASGSF